MNKINVVGTIKRNCERCGKPKNCNSFVENNKNHLMCSECMFEQFGHGKKTQNENIRDFELCKTCDLLTMRQDKDNTAITETHIIKHFQCDKCGNKLTNKIKKWRRRYRK